MLATDPLVPQLPKKSPKSPTSQSSLCLACFPRLLGFPCCGSLGVTRNWYLAATAVVSASLPESATVSPAILGSISGSRDPREASSASKACCNDKRLSATSLAASATAGLEASLTTLAIQASLDPELVSATADASASVSNVTCRFFLFFGAASISGRRCVGR